MIVSTIQLEDKYNIKSIKVNPILTDVDIINIVNQGIPKYKKEFTLNEVIDVVKKHCTIENLEGLKEDLSKKFKYRVNDSESSKSITIKDLEKCNIRLGVKVNSWREAIEKSGEVLEEQGAVEKDYTQGMIEAIEKFGSYIVFGDRMAIPHAKSSKQNVKTGFGIVVLEEPIEFPNQKFVDILIPFSSRDGIEHLELLRDINSLSDKASFLKILREGKKEEEIIKYLELYERES